MRKTLFAGTGGIVAGLLGSLCCIGPLAFVTLGVGAGLASTFEPLRPVFGILMVALLGIGFYVVYGRSSVPEDCGPDGACARPRNRRREEILLWSATVIAAIFWSFPSWSTLLV
ncbi:MAG TPA: mercuric transporter MerT family protein [Longimicrobiaceae bacterium]|nr:mercuric transporter MerT family protein [Longimicrobiaceae bacterium]